MSPLSLGAGLQNWKETFFSPQVASQFKGFYLHLNNRSPADDAVVEPFAMHLRDMGLPVAITGGASNDNVGKVIADQCRLAEQSEHSHPRGEHILLELDVDNDAVEGELVQQVLAMENAGGMIAEMFFEKQYSAADKKKYL